MEVFSLSQSRMRRTRGAKNATNNGSVVRLSVSLNHLTPLYRAAVYLTRETSERGNKQKGTWTGKKEL